MARQKIDIDQLKTKLPLPDLIEACGVELRRDGREFKACCPFHQENTPSFSVFVTADGHHRYQCFGCDAKGDAIQFLQDYYRMSPKEAIARYSELAGGAAPEEGQPERKQKPKRQPEPEEWQTVVAPPDRQPPTSLRLNRDGKWAEKPVVMAWPYRNGAGELLGYDCRVEWIKQNDDGTTKTGKDIIPITWQVNRSTGEARWRQGALPEPRVLYGTEQLAANPAAQVVIVEGCKAADAARRLLAGTGLVVVTWPGGCKAVRLADWSLLVGRKVVGWPDCDSQVDKKTGKIKAYADQPGMRAMIDIANHVGQHGGAMRIVAVPTPGVWANGYDLADAEAEGWTRDAVLAYIKDHIATPEQIVERSAVPAEQPPVDDHQPSYDDLPPPPPDYSGPEDYQPDAPPPAPTRPAELAPFRILGWDRNSGFYLPNGSRQVLELPASAHTKLNLVSLAPLSYWQDNFSSQDKRSGDKVQWDMAADCLMRKAQAHGLFDADLIRGRGAWWERGKWAVHIGDKVIINGQAHELRDAPSDYIYELAPPLPIAFENPLGTGEAVKLVQICERLRWEKPIDGKLLAGWVFLAPICGALDWRPHIWITGGAGSGKSTVLNHIIARALSKTMLYIEGDTTEAGIRQQLQHDALPVVFDEFESERKKATDRVEDVMALVTMASSETGGKILKGGSGGKASSYRIRSMFAFASIAVNLRQHAAQTRVRVLSLYSEPESEASQANYNKTMETILETLTDEYIDRLQARAVTMIPIIRKNARTFAEAAAIALKSRRMGDQIGTLLAGAYALHSNKEITRDAAMDWINRQNWDDVAEVSEAKDEAKCLSYILTYQLRVETHNGPKTRSIGELIQRLAGVGDGAKDYDVQGDEATSVLRRTGIRVDAREDGVAVVRVANSHEQMRKIMQDTPWATSYHRTLMRMPGAIKRDGQKFGAVTCRSVELEARQIVG